MCEMKELTRCPRCNRILVSHDEVHAVRGQLYCSETCAILDITDDYIQNAKELAKEDYASLAEIVSVKDVLKEELQTVELTVTCKKRIHLPANLSKEDALIEARQLYDDGLVVAEPDDCDEFTVTCALVDRDNSAQYD